MNRSKLADDVHARPELFRWNGPMGPDAFRAWLAQHPWACTCPNDLVALWRDTGGGDAFETETILGPTGDPTMGDEVGAVNRDLHSRGMPASLVVFHIGSRMSAVDTAQGDFVEIRESDFKVVRRFASFDDWYLGVLRDEYRSRYGLP